MLFVLYLAVLMYGSMIATDVATEKSSRVMELLVSSASPVAHMFAKIIGIALVGLTQVGLFVAVGYAFIVSKQDELTDGIFSYFCIQDTSPSLLVLVSLFLVGLFVAVVYVFIVSKQDELTDGIFSYFGIQDTSPSLFIYAVVFFLLGYLLYATLAAMLGSLVSRVEDVQQLILPMT